MKPVLTVLAIVALLAAGFAFYKFAGGAARLGSRASPSAIPENASPAAEEAGTEDLGQMVIDINALQMRGLSQLFDGGDSHATSCCAADAAMERHAIAAT